jgi:hypothetical protein
MRPLDQRAFGGKDAERIEPVEHGRYSFAPLYLYREEASGGDKRAHNLFVGNSRAGSRRASVVERDSSEALRWCWVIFSGGFRLQKAEANQRHQCP